MKKYLHCLLCLCFAVLAICPTVSASEVTQISDTYLSAPVDVCANKTGVFVADNVENKGVLHLFRDNYRQMLELTEKIRSVACNETTVFLALDGSVEIRSAEDLSLVKRFEFDAPTLVRVGNYFYQPVAGDAEQLFVAKGNKVFHYPTNLLKDVNSLETEFLQKNPDSSADAVIRDVALNQSSLYILYGTDTRKLKIYDAGGNEKTEALLADKIFPYGSQRNVFFDGKVNGKDVTVNGDALQLKTVTFYSETMFYTVDEGNMVRRFRIDGESFFYDNFSIGTNEVNLVPEVDVSVDEVNLSDLRIGKALRYPSNILFEPSQAEAKYRLDYRILSPDESFVILNYNTEQDYWLIFMDGKVGYIEKDEAAVSLATPITVKEGDGNYETFGPRTNVYRLPCASDAFVKETLTEKKVASVATAQLPSFDKEVWLYVTYQSNGTQQKGFVKKADVKQYIPDSGTIERCIANPNFNALLKIYTEMDESAEVVLQVRSGQEISYAGTHDGWAKVVMVDGKACEGYVRLNMTAPLNGTTHYHVGAIVFASLMAVTIGLLVFAVYRQKHRKSELVVDENVTLRSETKESSEEEQ